MASGASCAPGAVSAPAHRASRKIRATLSSMTDSGTTPSRTACTRAAPQGPFGPGIARSSPATAVATVVLAALQSETTTPPNSHSPLRICLSSQGCSVAGVPLTRL